MALNDYIANPRSRLIEKMQMASQIRRNNAMADYIEQYKGQKAQRELIGMDYDLAEDKRQMDLIQDLESAKQSSIKTRQVPSEGPGEPVMEAPTSVQGEIMAGPPEQVEGSQPTESQTYLDEDTYIQELNKVDPKYGQMYQKGKADLETYNSKLTQTQRDLEADQWRQVSTVLTDVDSQEKWDIAREFIKKHMDEDLPEQYDPVIADMYRRFGMQNGGKASDWAKFRDDDGNEWLVNKVTDEKKMIGKGFAAAKEEAIQGRAEAAGERADKRLELAEGAAGRSEQRVELQKEKQALTEQKFNVKSTDDIVKHKRQEEKSLKEVKRNLQRALILAKKGENMSLVDKLLHQAMSKWENTSVR